MDRALTHVDTRPLERSLNGALRDVRHDLNLAIWESVRITRARLVNTPALADAADAGTIGPATGHTSEVMVAAIQGFGLVPELVAWFRAEMGAPPAIEARLPGPIEPEVVAEPKEDQGPPQLPAPVEDAMEVSAPPAARPPQETGGET